MKPNRNIRARWILCILYILIGVSLTACGILEIVDSFWSGMGAALVVVGTLQMIRIIRYNTSPKYKENTDTALSDERNHFIRAKAWSWVGYTYIIVAAVATIVLKLLDQELLMFFCSGSVCILLVLYWIFYFILTRKY